MIVLSSSLIRIVLDITKPRKKRDSYKSIDKDICLGRFFF